METIISFTIIALVVGVITITVLIALGFNALVSYSVEKIRERKK